MTDEGEAGFQQSAPELADERARKILFDTYWSAGGWKDPPEVAPEDRAYAIRAGYMFPRENVAHNAVVQRVLDTQSNVTATQVGNAFLASLTSRQLHLRSALGSYAVGMHFPLHRFEPSSSPYICGICQAYDIDEDADYDVLNFERHKWGGVRHDMPVYVAFDLEQFARLPPVKVRREDLDVFRAILDTAVGLPAGARPAQLVKALKGVFPSNDEERRIAVSILGYAGILASPERPTYFERFVPYRERMMPPVARTDWDYPLWYWRARYGLDPKAVEFFFPHVDLAGIVRRQPS